MIQPVTTGDYWIRLEWYLLKLKTVKKYGIGHREHRGHRDEQNEKQYIVSLCVLCELCGYWFFPKNAR